MSLSSFLLVLLCLKLQKQRGGAADRGDAVEDEELSWEKEMKGEAAERSVGGGEGSVHRSRRGGCRGGTGGGGVEGDQEELRLRGHELQH